jgi:hypothetical protein
MEFAEMPAGMEEEEDVDKRKKNAVKRKTTLADVLKEVITVYQCHRTEGIPSIRFFNSNPGKKDVIKDNWNKVMPEFCRGVTKIGSELKRKILDPFVFKPTKPEDKLTKPLLVIVITDGRVCRSSVAFICYTC